ATPFPTRTMAMPAADPSSTASHASLPGQRPLWLWGAALVAGLVLVGSLIAIVRQNAGEEALAQGDDGAAHHELAQHETLAEADARQAKAATIRSGGAAPIEAGSPPAVVPPQDEPPSEPELAEAEPEAAEALAAPVEAPAKAAPATTT